MTREIFWLTMSVVLTGLLWVPYMVDRIKVRGLTGAMDNPTPKAKAQSAWAQRLYFAHTNAVDNLVLFAPLVLILDSRNISTDITAAACAAYFWARLVHAISMPPASGCFGHCLSWSAGWPARCWCSRSSASALSAAADPDPNRYLKSPLRWRGLFAFTETARPARARWLPDIRASDSCSGSPVRTRPWSGCRAPIR